METSATIETKGACRRLLKIEVSGADVSRELDRVYTDFSKKAKVPGFRAGKVPREVLELRFGDDAEKEVLERIIPEALRESIKKHGLKTAGDVGLQSGNLRVGKGEPLCFEVLVDLEPEFDISSYRGIKVQKKEASVSDEDVSRALEGLRERAAQLSSVEARDLGAGDYALLDIDETPQGGETRSRKSALVELDEDKLIPGFCAALSGMKPGEEREFSLRVHSGGGGEKAAETEVTFKVTLNEIKEKVLPGLDDDFARGLGDFKDLAAMKESIRTSILGQRENEARREMEKQVVDALIEKNEFDLPQSLVESHSRRAFEGQRARLRRYGIELEEGSDKEKELRSQSNEAAVRDIREMYILKKIAEAESITVSDGELDERIEEIAASENRGAGPVRADLEEKDLLEDLRLGMRREKVLSFLLDEARIK